jgi:hypothetical protein
MSNGKRKYYYKRGKAEDAQGVRANVLMLGKKSRVTYKSKEESGAKRKSVKVQKKTESGWEQTKSKLKISGTKTTSGYYKKTKDTKSVSKTKTQSGPKKGVTEKTKYFKNLKRKTSAKQVEAFKEGPLKRKVTKSRKYKEKISGKKVWGTGLDYIWKATPRKKYIKRNYKKIN